MARSSWLRLLTIAMIGTACGDLSGPPATHTVDDTPGATAWMTVDAGTYGSCALDAGGIAYCWGFDMVDTCPNNTCVILAVPTRVPSSPIFRSLSTDGGSACGVASDDSVYCWGERAGGNLGDGITKKSRTPIRIPLSGPARQVTRSCALLMDGTIECWRETTLPTKLESPQKFKYLDRNYGNCAIDENDDAYCWGGGSGRLGIGDADTDCQYGPSCFTTAVPMLVVGGHKWRDISMGTRATCGVTTSDRAYCWGEMRPPSEQPPPYGLLGTGSFTGSKSPVPVAGDLSFASISVGTRHVCGVTTDKQAWCWGSNASSELGTGSPSPSRASPQRVVGGLDFANLNAEGVTCGISANKNLFCWGITAAGALGNGVKAGGMRAIPTRASDPAP